MEDKSYLDELMDYMNENDRKRKEESLSLVDTPQFGMPLTRKIKSENPNIPQSDITDYRNNVRDDLTDTVMGSAMSSGGILDSAKKLGSRFAGEAPGLMKKAGGMVENELSKLPESSRFRELLDVPAIQKLREPLKQQNAMDNATKNAIEMNAIKKQSNIDMQKAINPAEELSEAAKAKISRGIDINMAIREQEAAQEALSKSGPAPGSLDETVNIFKKRAK